MGVQIKSVDRKEIRRLNLTLLGPHLGIMEPLKWNQTFQELIAIVKRVALGAALDLTSAAVQRLDLMVLIALVQEKGQILVKAILLQEMANLVQQNRLFHLVSVDFSFEQLVKLFRPNFLHLYNAYDI